jgi:hypothetical protein
MTFQLRIWVQLIPALVLLTGISTGARSLAAIDDSVTRGEITWNAANSKQKQLEAHNLEEFERRTPIESTGRSVFGRIRHYVSTHKELLASDAFLFAALSADAVSSVKCQHESTPEFPCVEGNKLLGIHPSELTYWGYFTGLEAVYVAASHLWWHKHPDSPWRHTAWILPIVYSICEVPTVRSNLETYPDKSQRLQEARARVSR